MLDCLNRLSLAGELDDVPHRASCLSVCLSVCLSLASSFQTSQIDRKLGTNLITVSLWRRRTMLPASRLRHVDSHLDHITLWIPNVAEDNRIDEIFFHSSPETEIGLHDVFGRMTTRSLPTQLFLVL